LPDLRCLEAVAYGLKALKVRRLVQQAALRRVWEGGGGHFYWFTSKKVQILTPEELQALRRGWGGRRRRPPGSFVCFTST